MTEVEEGRRHGRRGAPAAPCYVWSHFLLFYYPLLVVIYLILLNKNDLHESFSFSVYVLFYSWKIGSKVLWYQHWEREVIERYADMLYMISLAGSDCHMTSIRSPATRAHLGYSGTQDHRSTNSPPTISGLPGRSHLDASKATHWLVLKLLLRLITNLAITALS